MANQLSRHSAQRIDGQNVRAVEQVLDQTRLRDEVKLRAGSVYLPEHTSDVPGFDNTRVDNNVTLTYEGVSIETTCLPSPCWAATPHVAVSDGRLYIEHLAPGRSHHIDITVVYRSTDEEQARFETGNLDLRETCERLVSNAYGAVPPLGDGP